MLVIESISLERRLDAIACDIKPQQLVGVIGANGAGKSTLMKLIAGLIKPQAGAITWQGKDITQLSAIQRRQLIAYLPQQAHFVEPVPVQTLMDTSQVNLREDAQQLLSWRQQSIQTFALSEFLQRPIHELSGGEQRRVQLACIDAMHRPIVVADEPTASLDLNYQLMTMDWFRKLAHGGTLVLVAIHDIALAARYCDSLLMLDQGKLIGYGTPNEVLSDANLAQAYQVSVEWLCNEHGVAMLARRI